MQQYILKTVIMKLFTYFIFVITAISCSANKVCENVQYSSALEVLQNGFDIISIDWQPMDSITNRGMRKRIFEFTCAKGKKQDNYDLPDQIDQILPTIALSESYGARLFRSVKDYQKCFAADIGVKMKGGLFSASSSYTNIKNSIEQKQKFVEEAKIERGLFEAFLTVPSELHLSPTVILEIESLPSRIEEGNLHLFEKFIKHFGTHFISEGHFGGVARFLIETDKTYFEKRSGEKATLEAEVLVGNYDVTGKANYGTSKEEKMFDSMSKTNFRYFGGDVVAENLTDWKKSVKNNPFLFHGKVTPIYELIKDNDEKKELIKKAIEIRVAKKYLEEIRLLVKHAHYDTNMNEIIPVYPGFEKVQEAANILIKPLKTEKMLCYKKVVDLTCDLKQVIKEYCENDLENNLSWKQQAGKFLAELFASKKDYRRAKKGFAELCIFVLTEAYQLGDI